MKASNQVYFAPQLYIKSGIRNIDFYTEAFGATELRRFTNDDGTIHVAELSINGAIFHLHEESFYRRLMSPEDFNGSTVLIGLFVPDVDAVVEKALKAGAVEITPPQDYDYGYRQAELRDPFGHCWMIEMKI
ncbi:MAG: VOC family protein [Sphingobacteriales bacterium]|nr:MAG: VOC family protein [Sphingobacteriales bacterium]